VPGPDARLQVFLFWKRTSEAGIYTFERLSMKKVPMAYA
jgi:hypothetical protein